MPEVRLLDGPHGPILENGWVRLAVRLADGTFSLSTAGGDTAITSRDAGFEVADEHAVDDAHGPGRALTLRRQGDGGPDLSLTVALYEEHPWASLRSRLRNRSGEPLPGQAFHVLEGLDLRLGGDARGWRFFKQGWQNWSPTLVLPCEGEDLAISPPVVGPSTRPPAREGRFLSELVTALHDPSTDRTLTAGFVTAAH